MTKACAGVPIYFVCYLFALLLAFLIVFDLQTLSIIINLTCDEVSQTVTY